MRDMPVREFLTRLQNSDIDLSTGGLLDLSYQETFFTQMVDFMPFLKGITFMTGVDRGSAIELDDIELGDEAMRPWTEDADPDSDDMADFTIEPHVLTFYTGSIYCDITKKWLRQNIQGKSVATLIEGLLYRGMGRSLVNLMWNANPSYTNANARKQRFYRSNKGLFAQFAADSSITKYDTNGSTDLTGVVWPGMIDAMPTEEMLYSGTDHPTIYCSFGDARRWLRIVEGRNTPAGDEALFSGNIKPFEGHPVFPHPYFQDGEYVFCRPSLLVAAVAEEVTMEKEYRPRRHRIEYTLDSEYAFGYKRSKSIVWGKNHA